MVLKLDNLHKTEMGHMFCDGAVVYLSTGTKNPVIIISPTDENDMNVIDGIEDRQYTAKTLTFIEDTHVVDLIGYKNKIGVIIDAGIKSVYRGPDNR